MAGYMTTVTVTWQHNHETQSSDALRRRDVGIETREKLLELFKSGHSPSSALDTLKYDLQVKHGDDYPVVSADRKYCPDAQYCYRLGILMLSLLRGRSQLSIFMKAYRESLELFLRIQCRHTVVSEALPLALILVHKSHQTTNSSIII